MGSFCIWLIISNNFRHFVQIPEFFSRQDSCKITTHQVIASYERTENVFGMTKGDITNMADVFGR